MPISIIPFINSICKNIKNIKYKKYLRFLLLLIIFYSFLIIINKILNYIIIILYFNIFIF